MFLPGRDQVYARLLRQFADSYRGGQPALVDAVQAGQWALAQRLLHALRGACGAVGAIDLVGQAQALENQLQAQLDEAADASDLAALHLTLATLLADLRALLAAIDQRQPHRRAGPPPPTSAAPAEWPAGLDAALDDLAALLRVADFRAGAKHHAIEPLLRQAFGDSGARRIEQPLHNHDYDAALLALQVLRQGLARPALPQQTAQ